MPLTITPTSINVAGQSPNTDHTFGIQLNPTQTGTAYQITINNVTLPPNSDFTLNLPGLPVALNAPAVGAVDTFNFSININRPLGTYTTSITITTSIGTFSVPVSVTIEQTTAFTVSATRIPFPATVVNTPSQPIGVLITGGANPVNIGAPLFSNPDFSLASSSSPLPTELFPGATLVLNIVFTPTVQGIDVGTMTIGAGTATAFVVQLVGVGLLFLESNPLKGTDYVFLMGYGPPPGAVRQVLMPVSTDSELGQKLTFNGALWGNISNEKVIRRLQFYYENLGVAKLTATAKVQRYNSHGKVFTDFQTSTVTFGTEEADGEEYSAFFDFQLAGEIVQVTITRDADAGPCSVYTFLPFIEDKGEKVENV